MIVQSRMLEDFYAFSLWEIGLDRVAEATRFVFEIYFQLFSRKYDWEGEYEKMAGADRATVPYSTVFAALSPDGVILATIRLIEKRGQPLPMESDFGLDLIKICLEKGMIPNRIFEIARLAKNPLQIRKAGVPADQRLLLVDELIARAVYVSSREKGNIWAASIDVDVLDLLRGRGFEFSPIGETDSDYLGSPTTPVLLPVDHSRADFSEHYPDRYLKYFKPVRDPILISP